MNAAEQQIKDWHEEEQRRFNADFERVFQEEIQAKRNERAAEITSESGSRVR